MLKDVEDVEKREAEEKDSFSSYEDIIREAAKERKSENIPNSSMEHAEIGLRYLFNTAEAKVPARIVSSTLYEEFWNQLREVMKNFLKKGGKVEAVLLDVKKGTSPTLEFLKNEFTEQVEEYRAGDTLKKLSKEIPHFTVIGINSYRFELSHEDMANKIVKGFVNFNDENGGKSLILLFDKLKKLTTKVSK